MSLQLRHLLFAGLAACSSTSAGSDPVQPVQHYDRTVKVSLPADPPMQFRIEGCHLDVDACPDLCQFVISRDGNTGNVTVTRCQPTFTADEVSIDMSWDVNLEMPTPDQAGTAMVVPAHDGVQLAQLSLSNGGHS